MLRLFVASLAAVALTLPAPIRADDEAAALLAKHKAYVGWEFGDGTFKTMRVDGTRSRIEKDGKPKAIATYVDLWRGVVHHAERTDLESGDKSYFGFTGSAFWYADQNGFTVPIVSENSKLTLAEAVIFNEATTLYPAVVEKHDTVNGKAAVVIREQMPSGTHVDLYVDPQTGAYLRAVADPGERARTIEVDDYAEVVPGKRRIAAWHYRDSKYRYAERATPNPTLTDDDFRPPKQRASWSFASPQAFPIEVTTQRIFILARVNGLEGRFIFDSGASRSIYLTKEFAKRAGLAELPGSLTVTSLYGQARAHYVNIERLRFGDGSELRNVVVTEDPIIPGASQERIDGLIGYAFLAAAIVDVDLDAKRMTIYNPETSAPNEMQGFVFAIDLSAGIPSVPMKINGSTPVQAWFDTGDPVHVLLPSQLDGKIVARRGTFLGLDPEGWGAAGGAIQSSAASAWRYEVPSCGKLTSIQFGPVNYEAPPFCFTDAMEPGVGLVGLDFLKNFNMVFDYPDSKIIMVPRKQ